ncbi:MAG: DUF3048 domain-containing protein [Ilumatobacteraceae bacterium]
MISKRTFQIARACLAFIFLLSVGLVPSAVSAADGDSPLSGLPGGAGKPVIMVKLDNTALARPHTGLIDADLVYVEQVEWGLTRLAAMFNRKLPKVVGPVRSGRISDLEILKQFSAPGFVFSGANKVLLKQIAASNAVSLSPNEKGEFFYRNIKKEIPYNQMLKLAEMISKTKGLGVVGDVGFVFDREVPPGGTGAKTFKVTWPSSNVSGKWSKKGWAISVDGYVQKDYVTRQPVIAKTVVIQFVEQTDSKQGDRFGGKTPLSRTVGTGSAIILRNGQRFVATWSRPIATGGTVYLVDGLPIPLDIGQVWILLVDAKKMASVIVK